MTPFLNSSEAHNPVWMKVKKHLEARLTELRAKNDGNLDERKTALLRGRIKAIKDVLALDTAPAVSADDE